MTDLSTLVCRDMVGGEMAGGPCGRAAVAAVDAKGALSDGGHCCTSERLMNKPNVAEHC